jgi:phospholipase C
MYERIIGYTLNKITRIFLTSVSPLQYLLDTPGLTHVHCLDLAFETLERDGKAKIADFFKEYRISLNKGLFWADRGWKNVSHFYQKPDRQNNFQWPGAISEFQLYYNKSLSVFSNDDFKGMFYLGAALHLVQDMCVPHHSLGIIFDGHREFEAWVNLHWHEYTETKGMYEPFKHPVQWLSNNARNSAPLFPLVSLLEGCSESSYRIAAAKLIPLTIATTAGFLNYVYFQLPYRQDNLVRELAIREETAGLICV